MKKIMYSRDINISDEDFVNKILEIDASVFPLDMQGTMDSVLSRYRANKDEYILLTNDTGEIAGSFIAKMNETDAYECSSDVCDAIERCPIGTYTIGILPDTYDKDSITYVKSDILLVVHKRSPLVLAVLIFKQEFDVTMLLDNVSTGRIFIENQGNSEVFLEYFENKYNCRIAGAGRTLICTAKEPEEEILSILSGEMYKSSTLAGSTIKDTEGFHHGTANVPQ